MGWLGLSRYMFGGEPLFAFVDMAVHTAIVLLMLTGASLTLRPDAGIARLLASERCRWRDGAAAAARGHHRAAAGGFADAVFRTATTH